MKTTKHSLVSGLSYALDIAENNYLSHAKHVTYTSMLLGRAIEGVDLKNLYFAALIHDLGAGIIYGEKDHSLKGSEIIKDLPLDPYISQIVLYHHEAYNGTGPFGLKGNDIPIESQIINAANLVDYHLKDHQQGDYAVKISLLDWIDKVTPKLDPVIIDRLISLIHKPFYLLEYYDTSIDKNVGRLAKTFPPELMINEDIIQFAEVFSKIIDQRNPFTNNHSIGIAEIAKRVSTALDFTGEERDQLYIAALLHDIGKLAVDNAIINKPGRLNDQERFEIDTHTYYTRWILGKIHGFEQITEWAANHHEKLNGSGYPYGKTSKDLDYFSRVIAIADIYQALTEARPYRDPMPMTKVYAILNEMAQKKELDQDILDTLIERKIL